MPKDTENYGKKILQGWKMNQQQRRFLESFFPTEKKKMKNASGSSEKPTDPKK